jgi:hypothetical protein
MFFQISLYGRSLIFRVAALLVLVTVIAGGTAGCMHSSEIKPETLERHIAGFLLTVELANKLLLIAEDGRAGKYDILPGFPFELDYIENKRLIKRNPRLMSMIRNTGLSTNDYIIGMWTLAINCFHKHKDVIDTATSATVDNTEFCKTHQDLAAAILDGSR